MSLHSARTTSPARISEAKALHLPGERDVLRAREELASRLPQSLSPLAWLAYNYAWSWERGGRRIFADIDPYRWQLCRQNPVRLLQEVTAESLATAAEETELRSRAAALRDRVLAHQDRPAEVGDADRPVAFFCAEYGIHPSLPTYSGGLGVLAGDILKQASDRTLPMVGVGILYREGLFHQRIDRTGWQHEYWIESDPDRLPVALVTGRDGQPLTI